MPRTRQNVKPLEDLSSIAANTFGHVRPRATLPTLTNRSTEELEK